MTKTGWLGLDPWGGGTMMEGDPFNFDWEPCPFCGGKNLTIENARHDPGDVVFVQVYCDDCGAFGPDHEMEHEAVLAWNDRHPGQEPRPEGGVE